MKLQQAVFGGGCFWCLEAFFRELGGVQEVSSGYAGGTEPTPSYEQVCSGRTGHAEVIAVTFDPTVLAYETLLTVFFAAHDPTTKNRQGSDVGSQYRSIILYQNEEQRVTAHRIIQQLQAAGAYSAPIVTEVVPLTVFTPAEAYHQRYFERNPAEAYCSIVIVPKIAKLRQQFQPLLRAR